MNPGNIWSRHNIEFNVLNIIQKIWYQLYLFHCTQFNNFHNISITLENRKACSAATPECSDTWYMQYLDIYKETKTKFRHKVAHTALGTLLGRPGPGPARPPAAWPASPGTWRWRPGWGGPPPGCPPGRGASGPAWWSRCAGTSSTQCRTQPCRLELQTIHRFPQAQRRPLLPYSQFHVYLQCLGACLA